MSLTPCDVCLRRPNHVGGNASCRMLERRVVGIQGDLSVRESSLTAWPRHRDQYPDGCTSFQPGDRRQPPEELVEALEGQLTLG